MTSARKLPTISVVIPAYNEEKNLKRLLPSLSKQTYPKNKIEYVFIDDNSTDQSARLAKKYGCRVIHVQTHDIELNKGIGMHKAKHDFVYWLDADMEICSKNFFELMVQPMVDNRNIIGSFTREFALDVRQPVASSLLRFISTDDFQRDPVYRFFSRNVKDAVILREKEYDICKFVPSKLPPVGRVMFRRKKLLKTDVGRDRSFIDLEATEIVARAGYQYFAFVPKAKMRHYHAETLSLLIKKRVRNLNRDYLPNIDHKYFTWINTSNSKEIIRIIYWTLYVNLIIPELVKGLYNTLRRRDFAFLWQPVVSISVTDAIIYGFLSKKTGRTFAKKLFTNLLNIV